METGLEPPGFSHGEIQSSTEFTWAMLAAEHRKVDVVHVLLDAGLHPGNPEVFMKAPLLSYSTWLLDAERCGKPLQLGADPDSPMSKSPACKRGVDFVGQWLLKRLQGGLAIGGQASDSLLLLLAAGAKKVSPECGCDAAHLLARAPSGYTSASEHVQEILRRVAELIPALARAGHPIDGVDQATCTTPLVEAVRARNRAVVEALVAASANTKHVRTSAGTLLQEVETAFGIEGMAWFVKAVMRAEFARSAAEECARGESLALDAPPARRRSTRLGV